MENVDPASKNVFRTAAWMWFIYLVLQMLLDIGIYSDKFGGPVVIYYVVNFIPALIFLGFSYSNLLRDQNKVIIAFMILIISLVPILMNPLFNLKLPQAPLSNVEGMVLRQMPVLMIALVLVAWHYQTWTLVAYTLLLSICELAFVLPSTRFEDPKSISYIFTIIIRTVCFLVVGIFINQLISSLRAEQNSLKIANQKLTHYASTLENLTISRERNRMSRELHDTVVHALSGLSVQLETTKAYLDIDSKTASTLLDQSLESTRKGLTETRRALKSLRANPLEDLGLIHAIQQLARSAAERAKLNLEMDLPEQEIILPSDVEQCVYRITQEAVENVVHHANAKLLGINLTINEKDLQLVIRDDGIGFDPNIDSSIGHYGIIGMMERAQLVGGDITLTSKPNQGTTILLVIKGYTK
jgi:signal transduction histidine kinase